DFVEDWLKEANFDVERLEYIDDNGERKVNLVGKKGEGTGGLGFFSHSDTVPGQEEDWPAFDPTEKEGRLFGRGSCDMKGPLAATMIAASKVDAAQLKEPVYVVVTSDEEIGCIGAKFVAENSAVLRQSKPKYGVIAEPTELVPVYAHKGFGSMTITAHGKAAHTSTGLGTSANLLIAPLLSEIAAMADKFEKDESFMNREFTPPTVCINMTLDDGNCAVNVTASKSVCRLSFRPMPNARSEEIIPMITERAQAYGFDVESDFNSAFYVSPDNAIIQASRDFTGNDNVETVSYGTDGFYFKDLMDMVVLGPGDIRVAHTVAESVPIAELEQAVTVYDQMIQRFCLS
ncbi:MAG: M20/M25/M40 family metallo-hydrolase, partial [Chloroflexota bacterium]